MEINALTILTLITGLVAGWLLHAVKAYFKMRKFKNHLNTDMEIKSDGIESIKKERDKLLEENRNLKTSIQAMGQKTSVHERRLLYIYDLSVRKMQDKIPGFAPTWEAARKEAEAEYEMVEEGKSPFKALKEVFVPKIGHNS